MKYMVNAGKRRTAAQKAATRKMIAANKARRRGKAKTRKRSTRRRSPLAVTTRKRRRTQRSTTMARKRGRKRSAGRARRRSTARRTSSRRRTSARRRSPVTRLRRNTVYVTNRPKKRRRYRRNSYGSNPGIVAVLKRGAMDAGATLVGGAAARMASGFLPSLGSPLVNIAAQLAVGAGIGVASRKVVSADTARFITAGAMQVPLKNLITTFVPQAGAFLGDYDNIGTYELPGGGVGGYLDSGASAGESGYDDVEVGAYT